MSRVLLVEDEPAIADALVYALETECFTVTHALTGTDALTAAASKPHDFAILHHDPSSMRIQFQGAPLDLTAHEYKLLLVLIEKPGRVFTRDQLLDYAWQDPGTVTDRTVDAHIKSISGCSAPSARSPNTRALSNAANAPPSRISASAARSTHWHTPSIPCATRWKTANTSSATSKPSPTK